MATEQFIRLSADVARRKGIDWTARSLFFPNRADTIKYLEQLVKDLKDTREDSHAAR